ncbi:MAG TPA: ATP-binding protein [Candidatus Binatia bacterium]|nr:ATP-binding protein [Candidatus Binatia bacterium]
MALHPKRSTPWPGAQRRPPWPDVLASIEDGVIVLDAAGRVADLNPAAEQMTGISAAHAAGQALAALLGANPANAWVGDLVRGTLAEGLARRRSEGLLAAREGEAPVSAACAPVHDGEGMLVGAVLVLHDLGLQRTLEAAAAHADRLAALGAVAQGLAHEIRNPLGGIKGAAQLLRAALADPEQIRCTDVIIREVERLDGLVEQLRELSQPRKLALRPVNIHRVLNDVLTLQRQASSWGTIALRAEFDPSLPAVRGDRAQLTQVFHNLVRNAVEAMGGTGELRVATRIEHRFHVRREAGRGQQLLSVLVEDRGPGVPEEHQPHLFAPFFSTKPRGTGLGLALCHRIVREHGGAIAYEPRRGGGARFRVTLPTCAQHVDAD